MLEINKSYNREHTKDAINYRGEVFTDSHLVDEILNKILQINPSILDSVNTVRDNSCGNGQFLISVLQRKIDGGITHKEALSTIYGVDIDESNVKECRERLLLENTNDKELIEIVNHNIICADALDKNHKGWKYIGYMWNGKQNLDLDDF